MFLCFFTDDSGMICQTIGRTIMFSQVGFHTVNRHHRPYPFPMFRPLSAPPAAICSISRICATGRDPGHELASAP
jgi:hypothetical protein